jgi:hypothetical protein
VHATPWHVHGLWAVATLTAALLGMAAGAKIVRARSTSAEAPPVLQVLAPAGALSVDGAPISGTSPHQVQLRADTPARVTFKPTDAPAWEATVTLRANELRILDLTNGATR